MNAEVASLTIRFKDAASALDRAHDRLVRGVGDSDDLERAAAVLISVAEDVMFFAEQRHREVSDEIAYRADPIATRERLAAE